MTLSQTRHKRDDQSDISPEGDIPFNFQLCLENFGDNRRKIHNRYTYTTCEKKGSARNRIGEDKPAHKKPSGLLRREKQK